MMPLRFVWLVSTKSIDRPDGEARRDIEASDIIGFVLAVGRRVQVRQNHGQREECLKEEERDLEKKADLEKKVDLKEEGRPKEKEGENSREEQGKT
jgi:hypothetical protein